MVFSHYCHSKIGLRGWGELSLNNIKCSTLWALTFAFQGSCWSAGRLSQWQKWGWEGLSTFRSKSADALKPRTFYFGNGCGDVLGRYSYRRRFLTGRLREKRWIDAEVVRMLRGVVVWKVERGRAHERMTRRRGVQSREYYY